MLIVTRTPEGLYKAKGLTHEVIDKTWVEALGKLTYLEGSAKLELEGATIDPSEMDEGMIELRDSILQAEAELAAEEDDYFLLQKLGKLDYLMFEWVQQYPDIQFKR